MNIWLKRIAYGFAVAAGQFFLLKFMKFDFYTTLGLFVALAFLMNLLEHRNFAWGIVIGSVLIAVFGWTLFDNWVKPNQ
jgi:uncharacterized membrane protein (DUF106 family)